MEGLRKVVFRIAKLMDVVGGVVLTFMMLITVLDVILRFIGKPITGTYELVFLGGAVVIGCAIPRTSWEGAHVCVDFAVGRFSATLQKTMAVFTRLCGMTFFFLLGWNLFALGTTLYNKEEVSLTLHVPIYPVAYILGVCAYVECLVLLALLILNWREVGHE
ncbi:MAG: Tripartite ATP-independent periplasmic transporter [Syntrophorhabdaceae bacterium PtaU1.Bin034]|jgi:TRAP-type C4-dicarboxylate transport system permease small subunit|nr:MAG: Tripartite ATP-independent periplasmic transporter [Syntrophorhabdaceae bacterium PtaU1.Bin034]